MPTTSAVPTTASAGSAAPPSRPVPPGAVLAAFLVALVAVFAVAWSVGRAAGPVNPRMHPAPVGVPGSMGGGSMGGGSAADGSGGDDGGHGMAGMR
ncbi:hypothetical protein RVR_3274 [Actinacidiphila reveromycinica]|uniref:Uncharacterized protein n=1 Tax=Actinacidiphila reveromycinica TaxID=659352 RepID=A0A7U3VNB7_9ACTN|nr:hypothetical protein [Streptomyces sp. SN-593]BBA97498.1 hypothetical protein RVR_3274 [Streptomyces sp. SN-593]